MRAGLIVNGTVPYAQAVDGVLDVSMRPFDSHEHCTMKRNLWFPMVGLATVLSLATAYAGELKVGDKAPDFDLPSTHGGTYQLGDKPVVLAWFPKAYTRGCTIECKSLAENGHLIEEFDVDYFMVSCDPIEDNKGFAEENNAKFPLLSDPTKETAESYGVLNADWGVPNRHNYYIGADGTILAIDRQVNPATAAEDIAAKLAELEIPKAKEAEADSDT